MLYIPLIRCFLYSARYFLSADFPYSRWIHDSAVSFILQND